MMLNCRYTRSRIISYIHGELSPRARRRVTRHLDTCPACSARYQRERELAQQLKGQLSYIGQPPKPQVQRLWVRIQADLEPGNIARPSYQRGYSARYGLVALAVVLALVVPLTLGNRNVPFNVPLPPSPEVSASATETPPSLRSVVRVALNSTRDGQRTPNIGIWNTPQAGQK